MKLTTIALLSLALAAGCVSPPDGKEKDPETASTIQGLFVSGHLGNYVDCPGDGYSEDGSTTSDRAEAPAADFAPCEPGEECTSPPLNCEDAQVTIRLSNDGDDLIDRLQIEKIELLDADGRLVATLPLIGVADIDRNEKFDGDIDAAEELNLRVDFQGPASPYEMLDTETAVIKVTVSGEEHPDVVVESDELYVLPSVVT